MSEESEIIVEVEVPGEQHEGFEPKVIAEHVNFSQGFAGGVVAQQDMTVTGSGMVGAAVGRDMQMSDGGAFAIAVGNNMELMNGGASILSVGGNAEVTNGGAMITVSKQVTAQNSFFGILLSRETSLGEGSKVLLDTKQAAAFGAALGAVLALLGWLLRRK